jgi:monofunctional biosynthetic peptidoglycan transglycosylase
MIGRLLWTAFFVALTWVSCEVTTLPSASAISELGDRFPAQTALMRTRQRDAKALLHKPIGIEAMSPFLVQALIASEDARFFQHEGVDWREMQAAVKQSAQTGTRLRGASTLTQQLAKNLFLSERRSPVRKLKELWIARKLEESLTKERLLALYLNSVEWGDGVFGAEAAAQVWFGKTAKALSLGEAAALVAMLPNPRHIGPSAHEEWRTRTARVLKRLTDEGKVTRQAAAQAKDELDRMVF